jgi:hypothetical protein
MECIKASRSRTLTGASHSPTHSRCRFRCSQLGHTDGAVARCVHLPGSCWGVLIVIHDFDDHCCLDPNRQIDCRPWTASCLWQQHRLPQAHKVSQSDGVWHGLHDSDSSAHCRKNRRSLPSLQLIHSCLLQEVMMSVCRPVVISSSDTEPGCLSVCRLAQRSFSSKAHRRTSSATRPHRCPGFGGLSSRRPRGTRACAGRSQVAHLTNVDTGMCDIRHVWL